MVKISFFGQNFNFWSKFQCLLKISIFAANFFILFGQKFNFYPIALLSNMVFRKFQSYPKFHYLPGFLQKNIDFWSKFQFLSKFQSFPENFLEISTNVFQFWKQVPGRFPSNISPNMSWPKAMTRSTRMKKLIDLKILKIKNCRRYQYPD